MPFITSVSILQVRNSADTVITPVTRAIQFIGATVTVGAPGKAVVTIGGGAWVVSGNTLTGGSPSTPVEWIGSVNNFDFVTKRNNVEVARFNADGFLIGANSSNLLPAKIQLETANSGDSLVKKVILQSTNPVIELSKLFRTTTVGLATSSLSIATVADFNLVLKCRVIAKQTAGTSGSVGDAISFERTTVFSNVGGTLTKIDEQTDYTYKVDSGLDFQTSASGSNIQLDCIGVANRDFSWGVETNILMIKD